MLVCDASPLIFLAKIGRLPLLPRLFAGPILVPESVREEVLAPPATPGEQSLLSSFLTEDWRAVAAHRAFESISALSRPDREVLALALRRKADILLCDDRVLRDLAQAEGLCVTGTLGVLLRALGKGLLTNRQVRRDLEDLIQTHRFRIGIELYDAVLQQLENRV